MVRLMLVALCCMTAAGCAVLADDHRHVARALDEGLAPESLPARMALAPLAIPAGMLALGVDGLAVNPVLAAPKAADDATDVAFREVDWTGAGEIVLFPMRLFTWGAVFVGSEALRCTIPLPEDL